MSLWEQWLITRRNLLWCAYVRGTEPLGSLQGYADNWIELQTLSERFK